MKTSRARVRWTAVSMRSTAHAGVEGSRFHAIHFDRSHRSDAIVCALSVRGKAYNGRRTTLQRLHIRDDRHVNEETMDNDRIARNLACVEKHFHSEAVNEVEAALDLYTEDIIWDAPALNGLDRSFSGKQDVAKYYWELFASMHNVRFQCLQRPTQ